MCVTPVLLAEGINLSNYGPNDVADDMRDLAIALHLPHVDVRVFLDGALPTFALLRHAPGLVHAMALNSPFTAASESFYQAAIADSALQ